MTEIAQSRWTPDGEADLALIQRCIPHRYPFLMIDRVRAIVPSASAVGVKGVTVNEPYFQGHFPAFPVMPGVLVIEAMAQTSAVLVSVSLDLVDRDPLVFFMGVEKAKFRRKVVPGELLELEVVAKRGGGRVWRFDGVARVNGAVAAEADFSAMIDLPKQG